MVPVSNVLLVSKLLQFGGPCTLVARSQVWCVVVGPTLIYTRSVLTVDVSCVACGTRGPPTAVCCTRETCCDLPMVSTAYGCSCERPDYRSLVLAQWCYMLVLALMHSARRQQRQHVRTRLYDNRCLTLP